MKKRAICILSVACAAALAMSTAGFASEQAASSGEGETPVAAISADGGASEGEASEGEASEVTPMSLFEVHEAAGQDISGIVTEVSWQTCEPCHGDYNAIRAATEDMWEGIGQITDANPHSSHGSNAIECVDCHQLDTPQVNVCNQCHEFDTPAGWVDMDPQTTIFGVSATAAPFDSYRSLNASL